MSKPTYLDDLIAYKENVIMAMSQSQDVMGLLANDPAIDLDSEKAEDLLERNIFDYDYIDGTLERHDAYIMVDDELVQPSSGTFNRWLRSNGEATLYELQIHLQIGHVHRNVFEKIPIELLGTPKAIRTTT